MGQFEYLDLYLISIPKTFEPKSLIMLSGYWIINKFRLTSWPYFTTGSFAEFCNDVNSDYEENIL